jgi:hypothetical protein
MEAITLSQLGPLMGLVTCYALAIGGVVEGIKKAVDSGKDERPAWLTRFLPLIPMALGLLTGPLVMPMLFGWSGMQLPIDDPVSGPLFHAVVGGGVGSFAGQVYKSWDSMGGASKAVAVLTPAASENKDVEAE